MKRGTTKQYLKKVSVFAIISLTRRAIRVREHVRMFRAREARGKIKEMHNKQRATVARQGGGR